MEIGAKLKEAREAKNISLDRLQETTKIQKRYLEAIEQGNFHILPGTFYARAFIKEYATAVGLDPNELLEMHQDELPSTNEKDTVQYTRLQRTRRKGSTSKSSAIFSVIPTVIVLLLVVGIFFVGWTLYQKSNPAQDNIDPVDRQETDELIRNQDQTDTNVDEENEDAKNNEDNDANEIDEEEPEPEMELTLIETGSGQTPESIFELVNAGDTITLVFEPTGRSWLDVKNDQDEYFLSVNTEANEPITLEIEGEESIRINVGNTPELPSIRINDIEFEYPTEAQTQRFWIHIKQLDES